MFLPLIESRESIPKLDLTLSYTHTCVPLLLTIHSVPNDQDALLRTLCILGTQADVVNTVLGTSLCASLHMNLHSCEQNTLSFLGF